MQSILQDLACNTFEREIKLIHYFFWRLRQAEAAWEKYLQESETLRASRQNCGASGVDWIHLVQNRDQPLGLLKTAMNQRVP